MKLYLIRHCETTHNFEGKYYDIEDKFDFSERGYHQLELLKKFFSEHEVNHLYSSPKKRCLITAQQLAPKSVEVIDELRDIDSGDFSGKSMEKLMKEYPTEFEQRKNNYYEHKYPNGESFYDVEMRLTKVLPNLITREENFIVTHVSQIILALKLLLHIDFIEAKKTFISPGSITCLEKKNDKWELVYVNKQLLDEDFSDLQKRMTNTATF